MHLADAQVPRPGRNPQKLRGASEVSWRLGRAAWLTGLTGHFGASPVGRYGQRLRSAAYSGLTRALNFGHTANRPWLTEEEECRIVLEAARIASPSG